jgi:hypothetical protein
MKSRIPQTGTTCLPYTLHSCQTRPKQGIAIMDDRAAYFRTRVPAPGARSRRRRQACQLVNASTPSRAPRCRRAWIPAGDLRQGPRRGPPQRPGAGAACRSTWWPRCAASLFENKPESCPSGHQLWPGKAQVSRTPCMCEPAREAAARGRGMGHARVACNSCHDQLRQTVFFESPHDPGIGGSPSG